MKDYLASVEKLRSDAAEAALVLDLATDGTKREMYARLHDHLNRLADEVEQVMNERTGLERENLEKIASNTLTPQITIPRQDLPTNSPAGRES
jgi:hypothetical protein